MVLPGEGRLGLCRRCNFGAFVLPLGSCSVKFGICFSVSRVGGVTGYGTICIVVGELLRGRMCSFSLDGFGSGVGFVIRSVNLLDFVPGGEVVLCRRRVLSGCGTIGCLGALNVGDIIVGGSLAVSRLVGVGGRYGDGVFCFCISGGALVCSEETLMDGFGGCCGVSDGRGCCGLGRGSSRRGLVIGRRGAKDIVLGSEVFYTSGCLGGLRYFGLVVGLASVSSVDRGVVLSRYRDSSLYGLVSDSCCFLRGSVGCGINSLG